MVFILQTISLNNIVCECSYHVDDRVRLNLRFTFIISSKDNPHNRLTIVNAPMSP